MQRKSAERNRTPLADRCRGGGKLALLGGEVFRTHAFEFACSRNNYDTHDQLRGYFADFFTAYNFARRLRDLKGLTPYECI